MEKYASMWKADTPVERQADARSLWDSLTGIKHSKQDTTSDLQDMFPAARSHNKEASKSSMIRDRLLGAGIATGAVGGGMYQYNRSKKDSKGLSSRAKERAMEEAAYQKSLEMGGAAKSKNSRKIDELKKKVGDYLDQNPGQATAMGAILGGTAAGVGSHRALKRLSKRAV